MPATIHIEGLERLQGKLKSLEQLTPIKAALKLAGTHVVGKIKPYPPASEANRPNAKGRWYERGYGPRWTGGGKKTSKDLMHHWTIGERDGGLTVLVGNNVSYGPFVQDRDVQAWFHKKRGWKTIQTVAEEEAKTVNEFMQKEVEKVLNK